MKPHFLSSLVLVPLFLFFALPAGADESNSRGEALFKGCAACHSMTEGSHRSGPSLYNIFNQPAAQAEGYRYSNAMRKKAAEGLVWTDETLDAFLANPNRFIRLNKMKYPGMKDRTDRAAIIEYLKSHSE